ncbi:MAG: hypothetical protein MHM6MM_003978 [Cercozoa sp. M6MM]
MSVEEHVEEQVHSEMIEEEEEVESVEGSEEADVESAESSFVSPLHLTRIQEKEQMSELTNRFEMYIMRSREKDLTRENAQRMLLQARRRAEQEVDIARKSFRKELLQVRSDRDRVLAQKAEVDVQLDALQTKLRDVERRLAAEEQGRRNAEQQGERLGQEVAELQQQLSATEKSLKSTKQSFEMEKQALADLRAEQERLATEQQRLLQDRAALQTQVESAESDLNMLRESTSIDLERLRKENEELSQNREAIEEQLRGEFSAQLQAIIAERQESYEAERSAMLNELKQTYEERLDAFREQAAQEAAEREKLKATARDAAAEKDALEREYAEALAMRDAQARRITDLEQQLHEERQRPRDELAEKLKTIEDLKQAYRRKEQEFDELMGVKITLDAEINAFRMMLDEEEKRLGYKSPAKKRRRTFAGTTSTLSSATTVVRGRRRKTSSSLAHVAAAEHAQSMLLRDESGLLGGTMDVSQLGEDIVQKDQVHITKIDINTPFVQLRNGSQDAVPLAGWRITNDTGSSMYAFAEDLVLGAGESVRIVIGPDAEQHENPPHIFGWVAEPSEIWSSAPSNGDKCILIDNDDNIISQKVLLPVVQRGSSSSADKSCRIM